MTPDSTRQRFRLQWYR